MRIWITGGTGFVGSNIVHVAVRRGADVMTTVHDFIPKGHRSYEIDRVDVTDPDAVAASVRGFGADVVVHSAILNDWDRMYADRKLAWEAYVGATRATADAAGDAGAAYVLVSTDWVFDGTQGGADETTPPNPINLYGFLKAASEIVALERSGAVARVSGVNGVHRARRQVPREQDPGFGYFVASVVAALEEGKPFTVWESDRINMRATPSHAADTAGLILDIGERGLKGVFHCCGADAVDRMELARLACDVFGLDEALLRSGPPPDDAIGHVPIPFDTSITRPRTTRLLEREPTPVRVLLENFRKEYETIAT